MDNFTKLTPKNSGGKKTFIFSYYRASRGWHKFFSTSPLLEDSIFHCQMSIEKSLMAFLVFNGINFDKIDNFKKLSDYCKEADPDLTGICGQVSELRVHPRNTSFKTDAEEAKTVIIIAEKIFQAVIEKMPLQLFQK